MSKLSGHVIDQFHPILLLSADAFSAAADVSTCQISFSRLKRLTDLMAGSQ